MQYYELNTLKHNFKDNTFNNRLNLLALLKSITNPLYEPGEDELKTLWIKLAMRLFVKTCSKKSQMRKKRIYSTNTKSILTHG